MYKKYRKLIAALVGVVAIILGPDLLGVVQDSESLAQSILGLLTVAGVWGVPNDA